MADYKIRFNVPPFTGKEMDYIKQAVDNMKICGDGEFTKKDNEWLEKKTGTSKALLTTSCTHALELAALLCDLKEGDEVIMPAYTFVSTADAFVLRGAKIVFVDIRPDTMNIDENKIEEAITDRTKVIAPVHYAGVSCEMDKIMDIAKRHKLMVVEDAAQGIMSEYKGKALGTFGDFGALSFHETKNYSMGEGGALLIRDPKMAEEAEIIREKGTDRRKYFRGQVDKYTWQNYGSSYLPSDMNAAYLYAQLEMADEINDFRLARWNQYMEGLTPLKERGILELPVVPEGCKHNAHMFYIKTKDIKERTDLIAALGKDGILSAFHYVPLHTAPAGQK
ncbi:MAG: dTDP-4-amino-4,6-dideoxygalactose transaminase, partial [Lachnospiraceae bacterium]|nr:dTDP-4-amino-4,6-dideoxygalactose transaminase [Lachnospiraceae bacterium]